MKVASPETAASEGSDLFTAIEKQGILVHELKGKDAKAPATQEAIAGFEETIRNTKIQCSTTYGIHYKPR